jgi:Leucine-rich repeat (LRR) protein
VTLSELELSNNQIYDLSAISKLINLWSLGLIENQINDIDSLLNLINIHYLHLNNNNISDIESLVYNTGLSEGDCVFLQGNPLNEISINSYIPALEERGVIVDY